MDSPKLRLLNNALQAYTWRSQAAAANLSNLDTPGYERVSVSFEEQLQNAWHETPSLRRLDDVTPEMETGDAPPQLEDEMMELADTQMRAQFATRAVRDHFDLLRTSVTGRIS